MGMRRPDYDEIFTAQLNSEAINELEFHGVVCGESSPLKKGDRVYFLTVGGEFPATVRHDWAQAACWPSDKVKVELDCKPGYPVEFHRALFRTFTALDHLANT